MCDLVSIRNTTCFGIFQGFNVYLNIGWNKFLTLYFVGCICMWMLHRWVPLVNWVWFVDGMAILLDKYSLVVTFNSDNYFMLTQTIFRLTIFLVKVYEQLRDDLNMQIDNQVMNRYFNQNWIALNTTDFFFIHWVKNYTKRKSIKSIESSNMHLDTLSSQWLFFFSLSLTFIKTWFTNSPSITFLQRFSPGIHFTGLHRHDIVCNNSIIMHWMGMHQPE